ncbi:hypothetical protein [Mycolicibacterium fortuitum]|uniref:hypothetical protein n=1 Tax=Mycolicibacterium fortuitum TaxID=1766 RepID=UPI001AF01F69|nr:hypothetical protein [Mycolicibacterium fortuitum]MBP3086604.1 hypothetical protein [Mycolicibacterium fortuitum]
MDISRTVDGRTMRIALSLIRCPIKSRRYPAKHERLVTPQEAALLAGPGSQAARAASSAIRSAS